MADRAEPRRVVGPLFGLAAALTVLSLWMNAIVGMTPGVETIGFSLWTVIVVSLEFLAPATVLGMISPVVAKIAVEQAREALRLGDRQRLFLGRDRLGLGNISDRVSSHVPRADVDDRHRGRGDLGGLGGGEFDGRDRSSVGAPVGGDARSRVVGTRRARPGKGEPDVGRGPSQRGRARRPCFGVFLGNLVDRHSPPRDQAGAPVEEIAGKTDLKIDRGRKVVLWDLAILSFFISLAFMALEMTAGRLVTRHLGSSLYGWTSVIVVLLGGLSVGNLIGGKLSDFVEDEKGASWLFLSASFWTLTVLATESVDRLLIKNPLGHAFRGEAAVPIFEGVSSVLKQGASMTGFPWGLRVLTVVTAVFFLPAVTMGTVSPLVVKLAVDRLKSAKRAGTAIGQVYAWGMVGSLLGTFLTGFVLIDLLGTKGLILALAAGLALAAVIMGTTWHAVWAGIPLGLSLIAFMPFQLLPANPVTTALSKQAERLGFEGRTRQPRDPSRRTGIYR